jgi:hypothetical protein
MANNGIYFVEREPSSEIRFKLYCLAEVPVAAVIVRNRDASAARPNLSPHISDETSLLFVAVEPALSKTSQKSVEFVPHKIACLFCSSSNED